MAVPKIMNPDRLQPGQLSHSFYLVEQIAFRKIEKALFWGDGNAAEYDTDLERALYMGNQPEYRQPHSHEQTEPALSFDWRKAEQRVFHRFACQNPLKPARLISHNYTFFR